MTLLDNEPTILELVGQNRKDKSGIYAGRIAEDAVMPCMSYSEIQGEGMANSLAGPDALQHCRLQFSYFGKTYADAKRLARTTRLFLENFTGTLSDGTEIASILRISEADTPLENSNLFHTAQDYAVQYTDSGT